LGECVDAVGDPVTSTGAMKGREQVGVILEVQPGQSVTCSFTNAKRPTVTVEKTSVGGDGTFGFTLTPVDPDSGDPAGDAVPQDVVTSDGSGSASWGPEGLTPSGTYTLAETAQDGWVSEFEQCTVGGEPIEVAADGLAVTFTAAPGADIECAFTNTKQ